MPKIDPPKGYETWLDAFIDSIRKGNTETTPVHIVEQKAKGGPFDPKYEPAVFRALRRDEIADILFAELTELREKAAGIVPILPINNTELSSRAKTVLRRCGVDYMHQISNLTTDSVRLFKGCGPKVWREITGAMGSRGIRFSDEKC